VDSGTEIPEDSHYFILYLMRHGFRQPLFFSILILLFYYSFPFFGIHIFIFVHIKNRPSFIILLNRIRVSVGIAILWIQKRMILLGETRMGLAGKQRAVTVLIRDIPLCHAKPAYRTANEWDIPGFW
jgi:hypothetical protein